MNAKYYMGCMLVGLVLFFVLLSLDPKITEKDKVCSSDLDCVFIDTEQWDKHVNFNCCGNCDRGYEMHKWVAINREAHNQLNKHSLRQKVLYPLQILYKSYKCKRVSCKTCMAFASQVEAKCIEGKCAKVDRVFS